MIGIPISGPFYIYQDNVSMVYNSSRMELVLTKKRNFIGHYIVFESVAMSEFLNGDIPIS